MACFFSISNLALTLLTLAPTLTPIPTPTLTHLKLYNETNRAYSSTRYRYKNGLDTYCTNCSSYETSLELYYPIWVCQYYQYVHGIRAVVAVDGVPFALNTDVVLEGMIAQQVYYWLNTEATRRSGKLLESSR